MQEFVKAEWAVSPRLQWSLIAVLDDPGEPETMALALGRWEGEPRLAMRWNGAKGKPLGNPQVRGNATWFIVDPRYNEALTANLPRDKKALVDTILSIQKQSA